MLIYNSQKEFVGIDEKDLKTLGFNDLITLRSEAADFADLFVKTPGHIHNFKHVHWIDFIICGDSHEDAKAIINVNNKNYKANINIQTAFLSDNPSAKAYLVNLTNLRELTHKESEQISGDILERPTPKAAPATSFTPTNFDEPSHVHPKVQPAPVQIDPYETPIEVDFDADDEEIYDESVTPVIEKTQETLFEEPIEESMDDMLDVGDLSFEEEVFVEGTPKKTTIVQETFDNGYVYDPHIASDELGLPIDLIEEFIQDFIAQAKEFKNGLYSALDNGDIENVKILSHKLKGVAANLRIQDAFETLTIINTTSDTNVMKENLDILYKIIAKLAGESVAVEKTIDDEIKMTTPIEVPVVESPLKVEVPKELPTEAIDEKLEINFDDEDEDDLYAIEDSEVPDKIEIAELADDDFLKSDAQKLDLIDLEESIEDDEYAIDLLNEDDKAFTTTYVKKVVANEIGIDLESFNELLEDYLLEAHEHIDAMRKAIAADEFKSVQSEALKLKGMSDNMRVKDINAHLEVLMTSLNKQELKESISQIDAILAQISKLGD